MKERIFTNWTFSRMLFLIMGVMVIVQSAMSHQWFGILFGGYFAAMGLFAFGCAAGGCFGGNCNTVSPSSAPTHTDEVEFEEVQSK